MEWWFKTSLSCLYIRHWSQVFGLHKGGIFDRMRWRDFRFHFLWPSSISGHVTSGHVTSHQPHALRTLLEVTWQEVTWITGIHVTLYKQISHFQSGRQSFGANAYFMWLLECIIPYTVRVNAWRLKFWPLKFMASMSDVCICCIK